MPRVSKEALQRFATELFVAGGAGPEESEIVADSLVQANLRGHDSHGVMRIAYYIGRMKAGKLAPGAQLTVEKETPAALVCDGNWGFGQPLSRQMIDRLTDKARTNGIALGTLRRASHIGRVGEYAERAAAQNMIAIICVNNQGAAQRVAPVGGIRPRLGTNPICIGMPGASEGPFVLDFGTSATAEGKVRVKKIAGEEIPLGWVLDPDGDPTTDPNQLYGDPPGTILPMGGDQAYKGFGLAFMIEMLAGGLSGGLCAEPHNPPAIGNCVMFIVIAPETLAGIGHLEAEVTKLEQYVRSVPLKDGVDRVTLPGDPERVTLKQRTAEGIPFDKGNWQALLDLAQELGVEPPSA